MSILFLLNRKRQSSGLVGVKMLGSDYQVPVHGSWLWIRQLISLSVRLLIYTVRVVSYPPQTDVMKIQ